MVLCCFLLCRAGVGELPVVQVSCFRGCPYHGLDLIAHIYLGQYHASSLVVSSVYVISYIPRLLVSMGFLVVLLTPPLGSYNYSSLRFPELSLVFVLGLHLFPSAAG